jgi:hypothetical protein
MKILRSIISVLVSYMMVYLIVMLGDGILARLFPGAYIPGKVPTHTYLIWISTAIYALASMLGAWLCILWAPSRPRQHLLALFLRGESVGLGLTFIFWHTYPHWISLTWLLTWPASLYLGGLRNIHD